MVNPNNPLAFELVGFKVGDSFKHKTKTVTIVGYNPRRPKNCVELVELVDQNGKKFSCSLELAKTYIQ